LTPPSPEKVEGALDIIKASILRLGNILQERVVDLELGAFQSNKVSVEVLEDPSELVDRIGVDGEAYYMPLHELLEAGPLDAEPLCRDLSKEEVSRIGTGIVVADSVALETGTMFLVHPYRYVPLSTHSRRLVVVAGRERVFNGFIEAFRVAREIWRLSSWEANIGAISSPSRTGDIEKRVVYGAHGPREVYLYIIERGEWPHRLFLARYIPHVLGTLDCETVRYLDPFLPDAYGGPYTEIYTRLFREYGYSLELVGEGLRWRSLET